MNVLPGSRLFVSTYGTDTFCLDVADAPKVCWSYPHRSRLVGRGDNRLYVATADNLLAALSLETGKEIWSRKLPEDTYVSGSPDDDRFYVYNDAGIVLAVEELD